MKSTHPHAFNRFSSIDALRGVAAILVILQHSSESFNNISSIAQQGSTIAQIIQDYDFGRIGIICFFLISGFVIPSSFRTDYSKTIKHFAIKRFFRLYPAYWLSILLFIIYQFSLGANINGTTVLANTTMLQSFFQEPHLIGLYWTLQIELIFYIMCATLFYYRLLDNNLTIFIIIVLSFLIFAAIQGCHALHLITFNLSKEFQLLPYMISVMFTGALLRKKYDQKSLTNKLKTYINWSMLMCFGLPLFLLFTSMIGLPLVNDAFRFGAAHSLGFILFFFGLRYFNNAAKFVLWLGTISYSMYLFHALILQILLRFVMKSHILSIDGFHLTFYMALTVIISIIVASMIYTGLEKPAIRLGKKITHDK